LPLSACHKTPLTNGFVLVLVTSSLRQFGRNLSQLLEGSLLTLPQHAAFVDSCLHHCGKWGEIVIDGDNVSTAFWGWYNATKEQQALSQQKNSNAIIIAAPEKNEEQKKRKKRLWEQGQAFPCATCCNANRRRPTRNITVYRVTPTNLTGVADRDTGDDAGDVFFSLYEAILPVYCPQNPLDSICNITSGVLGNTSRNVYRQSVLEVDESFGVYSGCNPQADGSVECDVYARQPVCWYNMSCFGSKSDPSQGHAIGPFCAANASDPAAGTAAAAQFARGFGDGICMHDDCACSAAFEEAVGVWPCVFCKPTDGPPHNDTKLWRQINRMCQTLDGSWYSTRKAGECPPGKLPGYGGCFWREVELKRNVNASCVRTNFLSGLAAHDGECFAGCGADAHNTSSVCWVNCLLAAIDGDPQRGTARMTRSEMLAPFASAFASDDPSKGGCPEVPLAG
jgi:hypothetical protein